VTISVVQSENIPGSWSGSFGSNVSAGNTVFLFAYSYGPATASSSSPTFGGSAASGASKVLDGIGPNANSSVYAAIWMLPNLAGGAASIGLTSINGTVDVNVGMAAIEVSGLGASPSLDSGATPNPAVAGSTATGGTLVSSGSTGNITSAPELIVGAAVAFGANPGTPGSPWTEVQPSGFCTAIWQVVTSSGGNYAFTGLTVNPAWIAGAAAVTPGGGVTFTAPPNRPRGQAVNRASTY
jgi:hypothetical protein